jgi:histidinol-phosphatase (PHP family)
MIVDYHTHSKYCRHAQGEIEEYVLRAVELGLHEIGCSDHAPMPDGFDARHRMTIEEYRTIYAPTVSELAEKYKDRVQIKRGVECEFVRWAHEWNRGFIAENDFDFVIGSVHFVGGDDHQKALIGPTYDESELEGLYEEYYLAIKESARCGLFDVIAHCDLIKKFGRFWNERVEELIRDALSHIKDSGLCVEINTSGLRKPEEEVYPGERVLQIAGDLKIPMTIGSDAHKPDEVGKDFNLAVALIEKYAGGRVSLFDHRRRSEVKISRMRV